MNISPPPITDRIEILRNWCEDLYNFLKFPVFPGGMNVGDTTNYAEIKNDGELSLHGSAQVKHTVWFTGALEHGATPPDYTELGDYPAWSYDINDDSKIAMPIPKWVDTSATFQAHIVWAIDEAYSLGSGEIQWQLDWSACPYDASEAVDSPSHNGQVKSGDVNIPATAKYLTITSFTAIAASNIADEDIFGAKVSRVAIDDGDDPTADPCIIAVIIEFTKNKLGEAT